MRNTAMDNELKKSITDLLEIVTDTDLLDLVYKVLLESTQVVQEVTDFLAC